MFKKSVWKYIGKVLIGLSILFIFPIIVALIYRENILPFFITSIISLIIGLYLNKLKVEDAKIYTRDGLLIVALSLIVMSIIGCLPLSKKLITFCNFPVCVYTNIPGFISFIF